jgi:hypothetical protein
MFVNYEIKSNEHVRKSGKGLFTTTMFRSDGIREMPTDGHEARATAVKGGMYN